MCSANYRLERFDGAQDSFIKDALARIVLTGRQSLAYCRLYGWDVRAAQALAWCLAPQWGHLDGVSAQGGG